MAEDVGSGMVSPTTRDMNNFVDALINQGVLDGQFLQLQELQGPNFVAEVVSTYFDDSKKLLQDLRSLVDKDQEADLKSVRVCLTSLKGSSSSIGARRVTHACLAFYHAFLQSVGLPEYLRALGKMETEYRSLKDKLTQYLQMEQRQRVMDLDLLQPPLSEEDHVVIDNLEDPYEVA